MYSLARKFDFVNNFNDVFQDFFHDLSYSRTDQPLDLQVDVAGISAKDISISVENDHLIIKGETNGRKVNEIYLIPRNTDVEKIEATYEHGLLFIKAPTNSKKVDIKIQNMDQ